MQHRKWISAQDIDRWADTIDARSRLPELVRRLAHATVEPSDFRHVDFNAGEETQRPGYDGTTETLGYPQTFATGRWVSMPA